MLNWIFIPAVALFATGCAAVSTIPAASSVLPASAAAADFHSATAIKLERGNFVTLRTNVTGQSRGFALLGIITITPAKFTRAMDMVYQKADIQTGRAQTFVNILTERSSTFCLLFSIPKVSIRADLIEFTPVTSESPPPKGVGKTEASP
ncbi:MAG: hypothetical protein QOF48_2045 [Verrucomicrobiota bacterium]|jgi:hypothetical protein